MTYQSKKESEFSRFSMIAAFCLNKKLIFCHHDAMLWIDGICFERYGGLRSDT